MLELRTLGTVDLRSDGATVLSVLSQPARLAVLGWDLRDWAGRATTTLVRYIATRQPICSLRANGPTSSANSERRPARPRCCRRSPR